MRKDNTLVVLVFVWIALVIAAAVMGQLAIDNLLTRIKAQDAEIAALRLELAEDAKQQRIVLASVHDSHEKLRGQHAVLSSRYDAHEADLDKWVAWCWDLWRWLQT